jgi:hypothetical protein
VAVEPSRLRGFDAHPEVRKLSSSEDCGYELVEWFDLSGRKISSESGSPAVLHQRRHLPDRAQPGQPRTIAKTISEMLALPGTRSDYHFGMLSSWESLYASRRRDHRAFGWIESLCLADIALMEQGPELVFAENHWRTAEGGPGYPVFPAFHELSSLYQHEGFIAAAVEIEKRCASLGAVRPIGESTIARQTALLEEDGR